MGFFTPIAAKPSPEVEPVPGAPAQPAAASGAPAAGNASFFGALPVQSAAPTAAQQARSAWAKMPGWEHPLAFALHGVNDIGAGIENVLGINPKGAVPTAVDNFLERFQHKPLSQPVINALERQHPWYNYGVKWPAELVASAPLGEAAGGLAAGVMKGLGAVAPEGAGLAERALYALPRSMATGAAYGVQQPRGNPALNAAIGAVTGPAVEGLASAAGGALRAGGNVLSSLTHVVKGRDLAQPEIEAALAREFADRGLPAQVPMRDLPEGVQLTTAAQSGDRGLLDLQAHLRSGKGATPRPFEELAVSNNKAIENGIRQALAPQPDTTALSEPAHELLQGAQERAKAVKNAAYAKFDALKGGLYLERPPIQDALREAYDRLLPAHQEALPAKLREVMSAISPLHLTNDIEDLSARLNDLYKTAEPGTTTARAASIMRDALNKGTEAAAVAKMPSGEIQPNDVMSQWDEAKAANRAFRERFPQGTARDSEARQWLSRWLTGQKEPSKFLREATVLPGRIQETLNAFDDPAEREQMRGLMRNHYVNGLLSKLGSPVPGEKILNAEAFARARANSAPIERALLTQGERDLLDRYGEAAKANGSIMQKLLHGSSETAAFLSQPKRSAADVLKELVKHGATTVHPGAGILARLLLDLPNQDLAAEALDKARLGALLDPETYNRIMAGPKVYQSPLSRLLSASAPGVQRLATRPAMLALPRAPVFSGGR